MKKNIYIVLSQTGTIVSRLIKLFTHDSFNHVSISFEDDINSLYSFGRTQTYNFVSGGFVKESPNYGTFKRFKRTRIALLSFEVESDVYYKMKEHIERMYEHKELYKYNYRGLFMAAIHKKYSRFNHYYCSEFISELLRAFGVVKADCLGEVVRPMEFYSLPNARLLFKGRMTAFKKQTA